MRQSLALLLGTYALGCMVTRACDAADIPLPVPPGQVLALGCECEEHAAEAGVIRAWHLHVWAADRDGNRWVRLLGIFPSAGDSRARMKALKLCDQWLKTVTKAITARMGHKASPRNL